jgi:hypothetical protein
MEREKLKHAKTAPKAGWFVLAPIGRPHDRSPRLLNSIGEG